MARIVSTTTAGVPTDPTGGMTLDALMLRQKELAERAGAIAAPRQMTSPWQGAAQLAQTFVNARQETNAADELAAGRQRLAQIVAGADPETGAYTPQQIAEMGTLDPAAAIRAQESVAQYLREKRQREQTLADRQAEWGHEETIDQRELRQAQEATAASQGFQHGENVDARQAQIDAAALKRKQELEDPTTGQGKIMRDFKAGLFGDPASPEAIAARDAALAKENAISSSGVTVINGDSSDLRKNFNKNMGEKVFPQYLQEAATASQTKQGMELLDALGTAPQGPLVGRLAEMFPGFDTNAAAFDSIVKKMAPQQRATGSGSTSDIEYAGMLKSLPQLINNPEANRLISAMVKAQAAISIERGNIVTQWQGGQLDDAAAFAKLNELNGRSIMTPQLQKMIDAANTNQPVDTTAPALDPDTDALVKQYGGG